VTTTRIADLTTALYYSLSTAHTQHAPVLPQHLNTAAADYFLDSTDSSDDSSSVV